MFIITSFVYCRSASSRWLGIAVILGACGEARIGWDIDHINRVSNSNGSCDRYLLAYTCYVQSLRLSSVDVLYIFSCFCVCVYYLIGFYRRLYEVVQWLLRAPYIHIIGTGQISMGYTAVSVTIPYILSNILVGYELWVFNYRRYCKSSRLATTLPAMSNLWILKGQSGPPKAPLFVKPN